MPLKLTEKRTKDWVTGWRLLFSRPFQSSWRVLFNDKANFIIDKFFPRKIYFFKIRHNVSPGKILSHFCSSAALKTCREKFDESLIAHKCVRVFSEQKMITYGPNFLFNFLGGYFANSLAIMTDAAHLLSDFAGFMISLLALWVATKPATTTLSFGWHRAGKIFKHVSAKAWEKFCMRMQTKAT